MERSLVYELYIANRKSALLVATHSLGLFELLSRESMTGEEIRQALELSERGTDAMLVGLVALGLLDLVGDRYQLTPIARAELVRESPGYLGGLIAQEIDHFLTPRQLVDLLRSGSPSVSHDVWAEHVADPGRAARFTAAMDAISSSPAHALAATVQLTGNETILDVGGGSGIYLRKLFERFAGVRGTLLDIVPVCALADASFRRWGLGSRFRTHPADMFDTAWPSCDVVLLSQILHDWDLATCQGLLERAVDSLNPGGRVWVHEKLLHDDRSGPAATAMVSLDMLQWTEGQQLTGAEVRKMMEHVGLSDIRIESTVGYWSLISGVLR